LPTIEQNDALASLQPVISGRMPVIVSTSNEQFVLRAEQFAAEFGLSLIVLGNGREYRRLSEVAAIRRPLILPLAFPKAPSVATLESTQDVTLESLMHWDIAPENPARLDAAGVRFAFTTDRLGSGTDFLKALRKAVARGLPPTTALRSLTMTPAELFGVSEQLGTLESGKLASFVITDGDLFAEKTKVLETWVSGERFEYSPSAAREAAGHYELQLTQAAQFPNRLYLDIRESDGRLRGQVSRLPIPKSGAAAAADAAKADKQKEILELKNVRISDTLLTASFEGKDWGFEGTVRVSVTLTEVDATVKDRPTGIGTVVWIDGSASTAVVVRVDQVAAENATPPAETPPTGTADAAEVAGQPEKAASTTENKPVAKASFDVNYPLGAFGRPAIPAAAKLTAFVHATIWTCGPAGILEDATLIIDNGVITAVGKDVAIPAGAEVVDVRGMHLTPGIIDCHSHMATDGGVNEATQAITCEVRVGDFVDANDITIYRQLAGGVTAANILHGSANPIGGQNQVIKLRWGMDGEGLKFSEAPPGVKFALGENVKQSNRMDGGGRYPTTRMGVEQLFRDTFEAARDYARRMDNWQKTRRGIPPRRDLELEALVEIVQGKRWIHCHSYRQDEILALLRVLEEYGITVGTLQHILEGYKVADELAKHGAMASAFSDWWAYKFEVYDAIPHAGALMHQQGVVVSFNSDDGELARHLNQEAAKAVKYGGVPREDALKFVTLNPAKQLRIDHLVGSLETGKQADFVVWNGDPMSNFTRCEQTWVDGRRYFHREEDDQLRQTARQKRNTLIQKVLSSGEEMRGAGERDAEASELWPRIDEYCAHFRHQAELQKVRSGTETEK
jgi:N-acetylglucosamine-6-phosphate deacetylase